MDLKNKIYYIKLNIKKNWTITDNHTQTTRSDIVIAQSEK